MASFASGPIISAAVSTLEFYFGDKNYAKDTFLHGLERGDGWVAVSDVCQFPRLKKILGNRRPGLLTKALQDSQSHFVQLNPGPTWLVRRRPLPSRIKMQLEYYFGPKNFPKDTFLQGLADRSGFVPFAEIVRFKRMCDTFSSFDVLNAAEQVRLAAAAVRNSWVVELSPDGLGARPVTAKSRVKFQVEFYFGDSNYFTDQYLQELTEDNPDRWVSFQEIMGWRKMVAIGLRDPLDVADCLVQSAVVEVSPDKLCVRRRDVLLAAEQEAEPAAAELLPPLPPPVGSGRLGVAAAAWELLPPVGGGDFTAVQFNILSPSHALGAAHDHVPRHHLAWRYRRDKLFEAIRKSRPSLVALEEMQLKVSKEVMEGMINLGYDGHYSPKVSINGRELAHDETLGVALFWHRDVFQVADSDRHVIKFAPLLAQQCSPEARDHFCRGTHVAVACALLHGATGRRLMAVATHITCDFQNEERQVAQIAVMLQSLEQATARLGDPHMPVVILGDFNAQPDSAPYRLLHDGTISPSEVWGAAKGAELASGAELAAVPLPRLLADPGPSHGLELRSLYKTLDPFSNEPTFTTIRGPCSMDDGFEGCLDYIWFGAAALEPIAAMPLPDRKSVV